MYQVPGYTKLASGGQTFNMRYTGLVCAVAALGGLLFGYDFVVIGGAKPFYEVYFSLSTGAQIGWANSCALLGCLAGSILSGSFSDLFGRKKLLIVAAMLFGVSSGLTAAANGFSAFVTWRILGGIAIGIASNVSPTYIAEISPALWRGRLVSLNQITIVVGILVAQVANWMIAERVPDRATSEMIRNSWNGQLGWRYMFLAVAAPSLLFFVAALFVPESPRWLVIKKRKKEATAIFARIGGASYALRAIREMEAVIAAEGKEELAGRELHSPRIRRALLIGVALAVLQQWSGINILFNYAEEVYRSAGYQVNGILFNIVITGAVNLVFTLIAFRLVDNRGRRPLMLFGCAGVALSHFLIGLGYRLGITGLPVLLFTLLTIGFYAMSLAPITWVLISEIFPTRFRGAGVAISVSALWIACFLLTLTFPVLVGRIGVSGAFWLYALICAAGFAFIYFLVPETKGKTLEEIEREVIAI